MPKHRDVEVRKNEKNVVVRLKQHTDELIAYEKGEMMRGFDILIVYLRHYYSSDHFVS